MATVEFIEKRLDGAKKNLEKLEKKLVRILKAEESNYEENNPYYYSDYDKRRTLKEIEECKNSIIKYEEQLTTTIEKDNSRNVQVIIDFLNEWKNRVYSMYEKALNSYYEEDKNVHSLYKKFSSCEWYSEEYKSGKEEYEIARIILHEKIYGKYEMQEHINPWTKIIEKNKIKVEDGCWEFLKQYVERGSREDAFKKLEKDLAEEWKRKYDFIIERTNKIVGQIEDASDLKISAGDLNGIIIGTRGKAKVQTVGAGGYNIQIFHYRCYITEVK